MGISPRQDERVGLVVLAAGAGTRMRSLLPKPLHTVAGIPMVARVLRAGEGARPDARILVVASQTADLAGRLEDPGGIVTVVQDPPLGTGDAVKRALTVLPEVDRLVVLYSDHPLLEPSTVAKLLAELRASGAKLAILTSILEDPAGYGRIVRDANRRPVGIAERRDDDAGLRIGPTEINSGLMALDAGWARRALDQIHPSDATRELYLTDLVSIAVAAAQDDEPWPVTAVAGEPDDALGVNDRADLAHAEARAWERKRRRLLCEGVTMRLPETIVIDEDVRVGADTVILPNTQLSGATVIGSGCVIGPSAVIVNSRLGDRVIVRSSTVENSAIADDADVGPYSHVRAGSEIGPRAHVGNFAEIKNARLALGVKVGHFSYIGDAAVGEETNIGAGTVTANFDGARKHRTDIGARAFIGSDTILRAPISIGDDARTGAGSVVTKDVPDGATVVGVPARLMASGRGRKSIAGKSASGASPLTDLPTSRPTDSE
ncbi:MAG: UDP-N-acetylglucosamine pyrophosphorylase [Thermomicrobiales bacterium]|nr:UDP-N-acetylglucosamine pyrophosphorylase [Thermomicrobiales bacterium]